MWETADVDGKPCRILRAGAYAMRVRPRAMAWPADVRAGETLAEVVRRQTADRAALLDFEISFGPLRETSDGLRWLIERSTMSGLVGGEALLDELTAGG
jgi:hypothetical protein